MFKKISSIRLISGNFILGGVCLALFLLLCIDMTIVAADEEEDWLGKDWETRFLNHRKYRLVEDLCKSNPQFGNDGWDYYCGKGEPPDFMLTSFDPYINAEGNWIEEYQKDGQVVAGAHIALYKVKPGPYGPLVYMPSKQDRRGPWFSSRIVGFDTDKDGKESALGGGPNGLSVGKNGKLTSNNFRRIVVMYGSSSNQMTGTWAIDDNWTKRHEKGIVVSRRAIPRIDRVKFIGDITDEISLGKNTGKLEFKYQGPDATNMRGNRRNVYIEVYGKNLWGFHRIWIDRIHNLEFGGASYIEGKVDMSGHNVSVIGIKLKFVTWPKMFPGKKVLWIDDISIPFELVLNDFPKERLIIAEWVNATSPAQLSPATQKKLHEIAKLENHIMEWEYRIKKWTINLNRRKDGLKRIKKGYWASTSFYNLYKPGEGYLKQAFGIRAKTHTNVVLLEEEYYRDFLRYKIDRGENKWSYRELRKWLIPKEMAYQKKREERLKEMAAELESYQKYQQKNMIELEKGVISDNPR